MLGPINRHMSKEVHYLFIFLLASLISNRPHQCSILNLVIPHRIMQVEVGRELQRNCEAGGSSLSKKHEYLFNLGGFQQTPKIGCTFKASNIEWLLVPFQG